MLNQIKVNQSRDKELIAAISPIRLSNYRHFFNVNTDAQVLGLYHWNEELSSVLFRMISMIEIVLRNKFHRAMSARYGSVGENESKDWYLYVELNDHSESKIQEIISSLRKKRRRSYRPEPSPDDVVSRLTFGFWLYLLDLHTDIYNRPVDLASIILDILPGHRQSQETHWKKLKHQDQLFARLEMCNQLRNRIAHHEPIWKLGPLKQENRLRSGVKQRQILAAPSNPEQMLKRLLLLYERIIELMTWLSPDIALQHKDSELHLRCMYLLQIEAINAYKYALSSAELDLARIGNFRSLRKILRYASRNQQPLQLVEGKRLIGHLNCLFYKEG